MNVFKIIKAIIQTWHLPEHYCKKCNKHIGYSETKYCLECEQKELFK